MTITAFAQLNACKLCLRSNFSQDYDFLICNVFAAGVLQSIIPSLCRYLVELAWCLLADHFLHLGLSVNQVI